jgi:hypothetical protein
MKEETGLFGAWDYPGDEVVLYVVEEIEKGRKPYDIIGDKFLSDKLLIEQISSLFGDIRVIEALNRAGYENENIWPW